MEAASTPGSTPNSVPGREAPTLVLITRTGCHLCADAHAVMRAVSAQTGLPVHEVEIDSDPALLEAFRDDIPVLLINGQIHSRWHLDVSEITGSLGTL